jgi:ornithine carbamoyltransferase
MPASIELSRVSHWRLEPQPATGKRDFLSLHDLSISETAALLDLAAEVKAFPSAYKGLLQGTMAALVFEKPSLRTRVTFEVGLEQLGGHAIYLAPGDIGLGRREAVKDVARNLARWIDALVVRTFSQQVLEEMATEASIPVINALSDLLHPCQIVADLLTLREAKGRLQGLRVAFVGDGNNVAMALAHGAAKTGMHLTIACPPGYQPYPFILAEAEADASATGAQIRVVHNPAEAVRGTDAVYTDVWVSMGQEEEAEQRRSVFGRYQVDSALMALAQPDALFLHCLPAHRGEEVTAEVLEGPQSAVLEQAENRLHAHKAILLALLGGRRPKGGAQAKR